MSLLSFQKPANPTVPPPGTSAYKAYLRATGNSPDQGSAAYAAQQSIPPEGTSAHKAYEFAQKYGRPAPSFTEILSGDFDPNNPNPKPYSPSAPKLASSPASKPLVDYLNADLAEYYGMSKTTAYQEALSNTSYQRAVKDMRDAGLNPAVLFGSGHGQSANSSIYASEDRSGGGGGSRRRYGSGSSGNDKLFSSGMYYGISTAVGLATAVLTHNPANYWVGSAGAQGVMGMLDAIF